MRKLLTLAALLALAGGASAHGHGAFRAAVFAQPYYAAPVYAAPAVVAAPVAVQAQAAPCNCYGQILQALAAPAVAQPQAAAVVQPYAAPAVQAVVTPSYSYGGVAAFAAPSYGYGGVRAFAAPVVVRQRVVAADVAFVRGVARDAGIVVRRGGVFPTIGRFLFGRRVVVPGAAVVAPVRARGVNVVVPGASVRVR